ncbi:MAG: low molecular weight protein-tyrosine-phosphatase [Bacteroidota bacterium]
MSTVSSPVRILFVCLGNICRSPMAEGLFLHLIKEKGLENEFVVDSAGTGGWHAGERADPRMRKTAAKHGVELPSRARKVELADFENFDYILAMDRSNYRDLKNLQQQVANSTAQVYLMRHFDPQAPDTDVPDPYYGGAEGFENVYQMLDRSVAELLEEINASVES